VSTCPFFNGHERLLHGQTARSSIDRLAVKSMTGGSTGNGDLVFAGRAAIQRFEKVRMERPLTLRV
jgi:hypothetical protein